jgi:hypothetical protein
MGIPSIDTIMRMMSIDKSTRLDGIRTNCDMEDVVSGARIPVRLAVPAISTKTRISSQSHIKRMTTCDTHLLQIGSME